MKMIFEKIARIFGLKLRTDHRHAFNFFRNYQGQQVPDAIRTYFVQMKTEGAARQNVAVLIVSDICRVYTAEQRDAVVGVFFAIFIHQSLTRLGITRHVINMHLRQFKLLVQLQLQANQYAFFDAFFPAAAAADLQRILDVLTVQDRQDLAHIISFLDAYTAN